jgi:dTDP-4-amino-4,6-dideoxygalactose transaminase
MSEDKKVSALEERIATRFGRAFCILTGRATTAIYLILAALGISGPENEVLMPSMTCPSPANAVLYAGLTPRYVDVDADHFNAAGQHFEAAITSQTRAIMAIHLFGCAAPMQELTELARGRGLFLIEDVAQAIGNRYEGKYLGAWGDASVLSFGAGKILDAERGGALLIDDRALADEARVRLQKLSEYQSDFALMFDLYREQFYSLQQRQVAGLLNRAQAAKYFRLLYQLYQPMYLFRMESERIERIGKLIDRLDHEIDMRRERLACYYRHFSELENFRWQAVADDPILYRFSLLAKDREQRDRATRALREQGFHASNLYPPLHRYLSEDGELPISDYIGERILNLWMDDSIDEARIIAMSRVLQQTSK